MNMFSSGVQHALAKTNYHLINHNCDHVATSILASGGITMNKKILPNNTYKSSKGD